MQSRIGEVPNYRRSSKRVTITIPFRVYNMLIDRSQQEGRSISNLMAYLVERAMDGGKL